jgi:hypothetical protein
MSCAARLPFELLVDYWSRELAPAAMNEVEEHVFDCEACGRRLAEVEAMGESVRDLTARGRFTAAVPPSLVDLLAGRGLRIRTFRPRQGETIPCGAGPEDELLVARFPVDLRDVTRVDMAFCDERWEERERLVDIPFDREGGEIVTAQRVDAPVVKVAHALRFRMIAVDAAGERELGAYALQHDPRGPPPGS